MKWAYRIFLVISLLLFTGIAVTFCTKKYIDHQTGESTGNQLVYHIAVQNQAAKEELVAETAVTDLEKGAATGGKEGQKMSDLAQAEKEQAETAAQAAQDILNDVEDIVIAEDERCVEIDTIVSYTLTEEETYSEIQKKKMDYYAYLEEMEASIQKKWDAIGENAGILSTMSMADYEYEQWDKELNVIYGLCRDKLSEEEFIALRDEERQWIKDRDALAYEVSAKTGEEGNERNLSYTLSLTDSTKERIYELADIYFAE